jgi:uncharacterized membrane protein
VAGIGVDLKRLLEEDTFISQFRAYFYSAIIVSGPWLISIMALGLLWIFSPPVMNIGLLKQFRVTVVYTFCFSLISTGFILLLLTRFLSDRLYLKERNTFMPNYVGIMVLLVGFQALTAGLFYGLSDLDIGYKMIGIMLYVTISCIWLTMVFLSASRNFESIAIAFIIGCFLSFVLARSLGATYLLNGYLLGFTMGQFAILLILIYQVFRNFDSDLPISFNFLRYYRKYFSLALIGLFYNVGIWIDKVIFWFSKEGDHITGLFYSQFPYDSCMFLAFLTIVPSLAYFLVDVEVTFYDKYKSFYGSIVSKADYGTIHKRKNEMTRSLGESMLRLMLTQAFITALFIFFAPTIAKLIGIGGEYSALVRVAGLGAFFHVLFLISMIIILYFDLRGVVVFTSLLFMSSNALFTIMSIRYGPEYWGWGYVSAAFLCFVVSVIILINRLSNLEYITFTRQPIVKLKLPRSTISAKNQ